MDEKKIQALVADGVLADRQMIPWRPAAGHEFPSPEAGEVIVFDPFFYRGFSLPAHPFLKGLLAFYGISLHHLNPSSILHISTFIHLCEAFLGIFPHFNFFRANFFLKPQPSAANIQNVGGAGLQCRNTKKYFDMSLRTSNKGWHDSWFYCPNPSYSLGASAAGFPTPCDSWKAKLTSQEELEVTPLFEKVAELKNKGLTGVWIVRHFLQFRLNPLKERVHPVFEYSGPSDPTRESPVNLDDNVLKSRLADLFTNDVVIPTAADKLACKAFHIYRTTSKVTSSSPLHLLCMVCFS